MPAADGARDQTCGEKVANALSHGLGLALAVAALPILVYSAAGANVLLHAMLERAGVVS